MFDILKVCFIYSFHFSFFKSASSMSKKADHLIDVIAVKIEQYFFSHSSLLGTQNQLSVFLLINPRDTVYNMFFFSLPVEEAVAVVVVAVEVKVSSRTEFMIYLMAQL